MNDEFLTQFQTSPREAFAETLKARLSTIKSRKPSHTLRWMGLGFAAVCLTFAVLFVSVPAVRAAAVKVIQEVGGIKFDDAQTVQSGVIMANPVSSKLTGIEKQISRKVKLPTWIPAGFVLSGDPYLAKGKSWPNDWEVMIVWSRNDQKALQFSMSKRMEGPNSTNNVGPAKMEEVKVNGEPAAFARGIWILEVDPQTKKPKDTLTKTDMNQLFWSANGYRYNILTSASDIPLEELIRMAESVK